MHRGVHSIYESKPVISGICSNTIPWGVSGLGSWQCSLSTSTLCWLTPVVRATLHISALAQTYPLQSQLILWEVCRAKLLRVFFCLVQTIRLSGAATSWIGDRFTGVGIWQTVGIYARVLTHPQPPVSVFQAWLLSPVQTAVLPLLPLSLQRREMAFLGA